MEINRVAKICFQRFGNKASKYDPYDAAPGANLAGWIYNKHSNQNGSGLQPHRAAITLPLSLGD